MDYRIRYSDELFHHGILGQKWGVRRFQNSDGSLTSEGKERYGKSGSRKRLQLSDKQKKFLKIGAAVAVTGLAAYGAYKLYTNESSDYHTDINTVKSDVAGSAISVKNIEKAISGVNPRFNSEPGAKYNCGNCVLATELNFRGGKFEARLNEEGMSKAAFLSFCKNMSSDNIIEDLRPDISSGSKKESVKKAITDSINSTFPNDSRGAIFIPMDIGNHWFSWVKSNGQVMFADSQSNSVDSSDIDFLFQHYKYYRNNASTSLDIYRLDNIEFDDRIEGVVKDTSSMYNISKHGFDAYVLEGKNFVMKMRQS